MASRLMGKKVYHADREVRIVNFVANITGSTGAITSVGGIGVRSGSTGAPGVHTIHMGQSGSNSSISNDKYHDVLGVNMDIATVNSGSTFSPAYRIRVREKDANGATPSQMMLASGTFTFLTEQLSGSVSSGIVSGLVAAPTRDVIIRGTLFLKNSDQ